MNNNILQIKNLELGFIIEGIYKKAIKMPDFNFKKGQMHAIVGESGCGKSITIMSILGITPKNSIIKSGEIIFNGVNLLKLNEKEIQKIRGKKIAFIPQDPMTSLNPLYTIENQILETLLAHKKISKKEAIELGIETLKDTGINDAEKIMKSYPHELSGGMMQRVIISIALALDSEIIICDEPTTALDVTIQAQILDLLNKIKQKGKCVILITHNLNIVFNYCDDVSVMYLGEVVEYAKTENIFKNPCHPYTKALIGALPNDKNKKLKNIKGQPAQIIKEFCGCSFAPRCEEKISLCDTNKPENKITENGTKVKCHLYALANK